MRCKVCDWDIQMNFLSKFPDEDYCERCEEAIIRTIRETREIKDKPPMCPPCLERAKEDGMYWCAEETCPHWGGDNA